MKRGCAVNVLSDISFPIELGDHEAVLIFSGPVMPVKELSGVAHIEICKELFGKSFEYDTSAPRTVLDDSYHYYCIKCGETSSNRPFEGNCYCGDKMVEVAPCEICGMKLVVTETIPVTTFCPNCNPELLEVFCKKVDEGE